MPLSASFGDPRAAKGVPALFREPGANVMLLGFTSGLYASMAALRWTNPEAAEGGGGGGGKRGRKQALAELRPEEMELLALEQLPRNNQKELSVPFTRRKLEALLEKAQAAGGGEPVKLFAFVRDSTTGAGFAIQDADAAGEVVEEMEAAIKLVKQAVAGLPGLVHCGRVSSTAMSRCLGVKSADLRKRVALEAAAAAFPQAQGRLHTVKNDQHLATALLVAAHVLGAKIASGPAVPVPPAAAAIPAAAAAQLPAAAAQQAARAAAAAALPMPLPLPLPLLAGMPGLFFPPLPLPLPAGQPGAAAALQPLPFPLLLPGMEEFFLAQLAAAAGAGAGADAAGAGAQGAEPSVKRERSPATAEAAGAAAEAAGGASPGGLGQPTPTPVRKRPRAAAAAAAVKLEFGEEAAGEKGATGAAAAGVGGGGRVKPDA